MYATKTTFGGNGGRPTPNNGAEPTVRMRNRNKSDIGGPNSCPKMESTIAARVQNAYQDKINPRKRNQYNLVAAFRLEKGVIQSLHVFQRDSINGFEMTERRRRLLLRYYQRGRQYVVLYLDHMQFENYLPVRLTSLSTTGGSTSSGSATTTSSSGASSESHSGISSKRKSNSGDLNKRSPPPSTSPGGGCATGIETCRVSSACNKNTISGSEISNTRIRCTEKYCDKRTPLSAQQPFNLSSNSSSGSMVMSCYHAEGLASVSASASSAVLRDALSSTTNNADNKHRANSATRRILSSGATEVTSRGGSSTGSAGSTECTEEESSSSLSCPEISCEPRRRQFEDLACSTVSHIVDGNDGDDEDDQVWKRGADDEREQHEMDTNSRPSSGNRFADWGPLTVLAWLKTDRKSRTIHSNNNNGDSKKGKTTTHIPASYCEASRY